MLGKCQQAGFGRRSFGGSTWHLVLSNIGSTLEWPGLVARGHAGVYSSYDESNSLGVCIGFAFVARGFVSVYVCVFFSLAALSRMLPANIE